MAGKLTARKVETAKPGKYADGGNLYLVVSKARRKKDGADETAATADVSTRPLRKWVLRFTLGGKAREMGMGSATTVSLAQARDLASQAMNRVARGLNPILERKRHADVPTFGEMADEVTKSLAAGFRNDKHKAQWVSTLATYAKPLRGLAVDAVTTDDVLAVLKPIWTTKAETASRLRGRIEKVLDAAKAKGFREGENPARWRGHLDHLLSRPNKLARGHHAALPYEQLPRFMATLRQRDSIAAKALEFAILTAARSGEVLGARWGEFDLEKNVWAVPPDRMKAGREHRVPLSAPAVAILTALGPGQADAFVFPGERRGRPLSNMAMTALLRRMKVEATVHGFRSTFRDWAGNSTNFPRELAETALAHVIGDKAEQAYRRSDALERRRKLMNSWANYCGSDSGGKVVPMHRTAG